MKTRKSGGKTLSSSATAPLKPKPGLNGPPVLHALSWCPMPGFQAGNVDAIRSDRVICAVKSADYNVKAFQVFFGKDGSLFVTFPYFRHRIGLLSNSSVPANGQRQSQVNLEHGGKVTSHLVKYSHHPDGRAHFSQTGKIVTEIKRQSVALDRQHGHIFSLQIQGLQALDPAQSSRDAGISQERAVVDFRIDPPAEAIKFVGRWFDVNAMRFSIRTPTIGPEVPTLDPDGSCLRGFMVASPYMNAHHVLLLTCAPIPRLGPSPEVFIFQGGFDPPEIMTDPKKEAGFLAFIYPVPDADQLRKRLGSVDYNAQH
jgi:hypothetical protein